MAALAADPAGSAQRLEQLRAAADDARKLIDEANAAQRELAAARAEHERVIAAERTAHDEQLARDRRGFEQETAQRKADLAAREKQVAKLEAAAVQDLASAAELKAQLEEKLATVSQYAKALEQVGGVPAARPA
jgi:hypothetical protein